MRFTDAMVRQITAEKQTDFSDDICRGLKLRVTKDGTKTWALVAWNGPTGKTVRKTLGRFPDMTTAQARRAADAEREGIATAAPVVAVEPLATVYTFNNLADDYLEIYAKRQKKSWEGDEINLRRPRRAWGDKAATSITRREVISLLDGLASDKPVAANRLKALLSKLFNWAVGRDLIPANPIAGWKESPGGRERAKERVLSDDEVRQAWKAFGTSVAHAVARGILLTAQRPGEVAAALIEEIDLEAGVWLIPSAKAKNGQTHAVPLASRAVEYFREAIGDRKLGPVFPGRGTRDESGNWIPGAIRRDAVSRNAGIEGMEFTAHDLRRTAATGARRMGASVSDIGSLLNHTETGITAMVYALSDRMPEKSRARDALERWLDQVLN